MNFTKPFINRRKQQRRIELDPCKDMPLDLLHRKRRKSKDRRDPNRSLADDYYAFSVSQSRVSEPVLGESTPDSGHH